MKKLTSAFICLLLVVPCGARIITVDDDGPADFDNIQAAINDANDGDTIIVADGVYIGDGNRDIDFLGKAITVRSTNPNDPNIVAATIIDCQGTKAAPHRGFYFHYGEDGNSVVDGFTITNGYGYGAGIRCIDSSPTISRCVITNNYAPGQGGGIWCRESDPTIITCTITNNRAIGEHAWGGGICARNSSSPIITDCRITSNYSSWIGGGIYMQDTGLTTNCTIHGNSANTGDGLYLVGGVFSGRIVTISNCNIVHNSADHGGGIALSQSLANIVSCTITDNYSSQGSALYCHMYDSPIISNSILWGNTGSSQIYRRQGGHIYINYSDVQDSWPGTGNIDTDPLFVAPDSNDYHLLPDSPCIDAGDPNYVPGPNETDIDGDPRIINNRIDIGADEFRIIYVDVDATGNNDGSSWDDAYNYLQDALADANSSPKPIEIRVAQGIYTPDSNSADPNGSGDREATFQLINGVAIKGGYAGFGQPDPNARDIRTYETILSGDLNGDDGPNFSNNGDNSYQVVRGDGTNETAVLDGFTITGGNANGSWPNYYGGGMYNYNRRGYNNPTINNCTFIHNWAKSGGAIGGHRSNPILTDCKFIGNSAGYNGGGMYNNVCDPTLINCVFSGNSTSNRGGGIYDYTNSDPILINCTFSGNLAGAGGGIYSYEHEPTLTNCILWGNSDNGGMDESAQIHIYRDAPVINYSCIEGWTGDFGGTGNHGDDPLFVDANNGDYHLLPNSPCINAGDPNYIPEPNETDLDGNPRVNGGRIDMGAYESIMHEARLWIWPRVINRKSRQPRIMAWLRLPQGITKDQIDRDVPLILHPGGIKAVRQFVFQNRRRGDHNTSIFAFFNKAELMDAVPDNGPVQLQVLGHLLEPGQYFYGSDTVRIITRQLPRRRR